MLLVFWNFLRSTHSPPASVWAGRSAVNQSGATNRLPSRDTNASPSQYARTPSSFSLIHQPVGSWSSSHLCASRIGGAVGLATAGALRRPDAVRDAAADFPAVAAVPTRAVSAASPRYARRCLQVRRSIAAPWFFHPGQLHM